MKRLISIIFLVIAIHSTVKAQVNEVELVVNASGADKEQAINNGLRMAIEQTFGTFVSSNTTLLDDELVKDEIVTISSGTIKNYSELSSMDIASGEVSVSLKVIVSVSKLTEYAESHGSSCELKGATLGANVKLQRLYENNERIAIQNLYSEVSKVNNLVDYDISIESATVRGVRIKLTVKATKNLQLLNEMVFNTLSSLSLTEEERIARKELGLESHINKFLYGGKETGGYLEPYYIYFYTRNYYSFLNGSGGGDNGDGIQGELLSYINKKINEFVVSCNISSPVKYQITDFKSDKFLCSYSYSDYGGYHPHYENGHPTILVKLDNAHCYPLPYTIWTKPIKSKASTRKTRLKNIVQNVVLDRPIYRDNDIIIDKTNDLKYEDVSGRIIGNVSWMYEINEQELSNITGFYIEPLLIEEKKEVESNQPSFDPDGPRPLFRISY